MQRERAINAYRERTRIPQQVRVSETVDHNVNGTIYIRD
jgi:hypothetical protein